MRIANIAGRLALLAGHGRALDVEQASSARFGSDPQAVYDRWDDFTAWAAVADLSAAEPFDPARLGAPAPAPRQVFAIGLNYRDHAAESGFEVPDRLPPTFTKWPSCITGPYGDILLPAGGHTDWEVELVAVVGRYAKGVTESAGWDHVAGLAIGQDLSERITQLSGPARSSASANPSPDSARSARGW